MRFAASTQITEYPALISASVALDPAAPAPMITTSTSADFAAVPVPTSAEVATVAFVNVLRVIAIGRLAPLNCHQPNPVVR